MMRIIGIIREEKTPPDNRVPLSPRQCKELETKFGARIKIQPSPIRCFMDEEYRKAGISVTEDMSDCEILLGVKEVPVDLLILNKTYFFFSHTIKRQAHNRKLLQAILKKNIRLIDYETLTDAEGNRLIAFGKFAGMVGAHNALWTYGERTGRFHLPRMKDLHDYEAAKSVYQTVDFPPVKIVLTGTGRVSSGAVTVLRDMGIRQVSPEDFLEKTFDHAVFTQLDSTHYVRMKNGQPFKKEDFYTHPDIFESAFLPFAKISDIMINGIYWDNRAPAFFDLHEMKSPDFGLEVIADVTCDIAPVSSIPSTLRASTIANPVFGFDPLTGKETNPFQTGVIDMMTIDNLPNELPRDASEAFGNQLLDRVAPELFKEKSAVLERATIAEKGHLTERFAYLTDFVNENSPVAQT